MFKCEVCGAGVDAGLYRINPKGEVGKWACIEHVPKECAPHEETVEVVAAIAKGEGK